MLFHGDALPSFMCNTILWGLFFSTPQLEIPHSIENFEGNIVLKINIKNSSYNSLMFSIISSDD